VTGRYVVEGALTELTSEDGLAKLGQVTEATVTHLFEAALRSPPGAAGGPGAFGPTGSGAGGGSYLSRMAHMSAAAFGAAFSAEVERQLGSDGRGPLSRSIGATARQVSSSVVSGIDAELSSMFPGCTGADRSACLQATARDLGAAASEGFVEGLLRAAAWRVLVLAFVLGILAALAAQATWALLRWAWRRPPARREART
jgi:hypothetical protein